MKRIGKHKIYNGDCLHIMKQLDDQSIDMVLCDLPYGTTTCTWDVIIPFSKLWQQYTRIIKSNGAIVLFGQEPFSSHLRLSNIAMYKYDWLWRKSRPSGFTNAKLKPLKDIENISVFSKGTTANKSKNLMLYNPQGLEDCNVKWSRPSTYFGKDRHINPTRANQALERVITKKSYPRQVLDFSNSNKNQFHPTQKPVDLLEYLIKTYTNKGMLVLDNTMGSGSTGVACINTSRTFIGIEKDTDYYNIAKKRLKEARSSKIKSKTS